MTVKKEYEFDFLDDTWGGAKDRMQDLTDELREELENLIEGDVEAVFGEEIPEEGRVNDFLWFEDDTYAEWLGFDSSDQMWEYCKLVKKVDEDDIYVDNNEELTTKDLIQDDFELYQSENPDWEEYYSDWEDFADDNGYTKFERN